MIFYCNIQIPRISGNFDACADSVYQALFPRKKGSLGSRLATAVRVEIQSQKGFSTVYHGMYEEDKTVASNFVRREDGDRHLRSSQNVASSIPPS